MATEDTDPLIEEARALIKQGKAREAVRRLRVNCNASNRNPLHWYTYGIAQAESGDIPAAAQAFERALELSPANLAILTSLGRACNLLQQYQKAVDCLNQVLAISATHRPAIMLLITAYMALQQFEQAEALCNAVYNAEPNNAGILFQLGAIKKSQNKLDQAMVFFDRALVLQPGAVHILVNKGLVLQSTGHLDEAIALFQQATQQAPAMAQYWYILAMAWLGKSELTPAIQCLEKSFQLDPENIETGRQLAQALRHVGRTGECEVVCRKVLSVDPQNAEALFFQDAFSKQKNNQQLERVPAEVTRQMYKGQDIGKKFDASLKHSLAYKAPEVLNEAVREALGEDRAANKIDILELGCGSGLCGSRFVDIANALIGTDISPDMLEAAKEKQTYTDLYAADLIDVLENYKATMDLVIAMDVLCYFGDLTPIFQRCHDVLAEKGIFAFSTVKPKTSALWELQDQGHFVHSLAHLQQVGEKAGFKQIFAREMPLRRELNEDQYGYVCLYQKT